MENQEKVLQVGVLIGNFSTKHPMEVLKGLYAGAEGKNVNITLFSGAQGGIFSYWDEDNARKREDSFAEYDYQYNALNDYAVLAGMDVLIVAYGTISMYLSPEERDRFFESFDDIPIIVIQEYDEHHDYNYIIADNYHAVKKMVDHLIDDHNRKKVVCLSGPHMNTDSVERLRGYMDSMWEHGFRVESSMIAYGDYTQRVEHLVEKLLDDNPDADGIACGNDEMAIAAYSVCERRGLTVGKDISIIGFDDVELASGLNPPLSTARQDGYELGRMAMNLAIKGVKNDGNHLHILETPFIKRGSCGCDYIAETDMSNITALINGLGTDRSKAHIENLAKVISIESLHQVHDRASERASAVFTRDIINTLMKVRTFELNPYCESSLRGEFSESIIVFSKNKAVKDMKWRSFTGYLQMIIEEENNIDPSKDKIIFRYGLAEMLHQFIESSLAQENAEQNEMLMRRYWDVPVVIRVLNEHVLDWNAFFSFAIKQIVNQGAKSAFILLADEYVTHTKGNHFVCPDELYLAASYVEGRVNVYPEKSGVRVNRNTGFSVLYEEGLGHKYDAFILFSEEIQYGILVCDLEPDAIANMHGISMQISSAMSYMQLTRREDATKRELWDTLKILREKNKILNSVSSNDPMTGIFNRRGFMEKALEIIRINEGAEAVIFFADMDHLKEVNDEFGHNEGDYALMQIADAMGTMVGIKGCCGRIGGDEFIGMIPCSLREAKSKAAEFKAALSALNDTSGKPYYIESSMGYVGFKCSEDAQIEQLISQADSIMYEAKKNRRTSIKREEA